MQEIMPVVEKEKLSPDRTYKSRLFMMVFQEKKELLELYNAVNGSAYNDPDQLEINTLENAIYLSMKNDVSFVIDSRMMLYEHQSTYSPNLPLRNLFYVSDLYSGMTKGKNLHGSKLIRIPSPRFYIFYNGKEEFPDILRMKLSEAYEIADEDDPALELKVTMLNINLGKNQNILEASKTLHDYAIYTDRVRRYANTMPLAEAVELAITECIQEEVLTDFLRKYRAEAKKVSIYEYDEEQQRAFDREEGRELGLAEGEKIGKSIGRRELLIELVCKKLARGKEVSMIADELEEEIRIISEICEIAKEFAPEYDVQRICEKIMK